MCFSYKYCVHSTHLCYPICLYKLSYLIRYSLSLSAGGEAYCFHRWLLPGGGEASGLQPSGIDSPTLFPLLSPPSLPRGFALLQAFGVGLRHARGFASDRALAAAFSATFVSRVFLLIVLNKQEDRDVIQQLGP